MLPDFMGPAVADTNLQMPYPTVDEKYCNAGLVNARGTASTGLDESTIESDLDIARGIALALVISSVFWSLIGLGLWYLIHV